MGTDYFKELPNNWEVKKFGDVAKITCGVAATPEYVDASVGIPFFSARNVQNGRLDLSYFQYISVELHKKLTKNTKPERGDILLTRVGAGIGEAAVVNIDFEFSVYVSLTLIKCSQQIESEFIKLLLNTNYYRYLATRDQFAGGGVQNLNVQMVKDYPIPVPPLLEQKKIAQILSTWDQAISATEKLLENSQQQKKALMQQLLTGKKRLLYENGIKFAEEWQRIELGLLLDYKQPTPYLVESTAYSDIYETPVLTAGKTFILGYTNECSGIYQDQLPVIIFDDFTTDSKFVDFPFKAKSSAMKILTARKGVSIKFVFEAMQMLQFSVGGHQRHWISIFSNLVISIPNLKEQEKIAEILSAADKEIEILQKKLDCLKQEKKALMQQLLTGKKRVKVAA
ncbi:restriction endonuclease subunit S [Acinetobacter soli]|uniref:restriction endonuclease subunit S n=1 Tax=Acinetobacter soli TaxID=487316 RepID=UPI001D09B855|nr:restriction endonuclease subunit S [Acinetobacter soli]MCB8769376.1 restriction endonuclease subunit S [Acinetobacter soli]